MKQINKLHDRAMDAAEEAILADRSNRQKACKLRSQAYRLEAESANLAVKRKMGEPSRSILLRSAATLALQCNKMREAEKLVALALSGNPPPEILDELRDLLEQIHFGRHLDLRGIVLSGDEFQLSIAGASVSHGVAPSGEFVQRIDTIQKLLHRTAEQQENVPYRDAAAPSKDLRADFGLWLSAPLRAGSLAVTLKIGRSNDQGELDPSPARNLIDVLFDRLDHFQEGAEERLRAEIPEEPYHRNFVQLAKKLAPSGDSIRLIGLTAMRDGRQRSVQITRQARDGGGAGRPKGQRPKDKLATYSGVLLAASSVVPSDDTIKIVPEGKRPVSIHVPTGIMGDIVRPLWGLQVEVEGERGPGGKITLRDIRQL